MSLLRSSSVRSLVLMVPSALVAQSVTVTAVENPLSPDGRLCPGSHATVHYAPATLSFDEGAVSVRVGGKTAIVKPGEDADGVRNGSFEILVPLDLTPGLVELVVFTPGGDSPPFRINLDAYAPGLGMLLRSEAASVPTPGAWYACLPGRTAAPGDLLTAVAWGLGAVSGGKTVLQPEITVGGVPADVLKSVPASYGGTIGDYWVVFRVPPGEGYHEVVLRIGEKSSNGVLLDPVFLPVGAAIIQVTAADYQPAPAAAETIMVGAACGGVMSTGRGQANPPDLPTTLAGSNIRVKDSKGVERLAPLFVVSPSTVGYLVPSGTANGLATVTATTTDGVVLSSSRLEIQPVVPRLFSVWKGWAARGLVVRLRNGAQLVENIDSGRVDMGPDTDQVYLVLWASGVRGRTSLGNVTVRIGGVDTAVEYAGPQSELPGLDQVNVRLPRSLAGRGIVPLELVADGKAANAAYLDFQ